MFGFNLSVSSWIVRKFIFFNCEHLVEPLLHHEVLRIVMWRENISINEWANIVKRDIWISNPKYLRIWGGFEEGFYDLFGNICTLE